MGRQPYRAENRHEDGDAITGLFHSASAWSAVRFPCKQQSERAVDSVAR